MYKTHLCMDSITKIQIYNHLLKKTGIFALYLNKSLYNFVAYTITRHKNMCAKQIHLCAKQIYLCAKEIYLCAKQIYLCAIQIHLCAKQYISVQNKYISVQNKYISVQNKYISVQKIIHVGRKSATNNNKKK